MSRLERWRSADGFTLVEMLAILSLVSILSIIGVPLLQNFSRSIRLSESRRQVERELHLARLTAVSFNRPMRVHFNCPVAGKFRMVELIGTPATPDARDGAANRCNVAAYPYPAGDQNVLTRPNHDGPVRHLGDGVTFAAAQTIEFWPDGSAHVDSGGVNPWPAITGSGVPFTVTYGPSSKSIMVNGVGRIQTIP